MTPLKRLPFSKYALFCLLFLLGNIANAGVHTSPSDSREYLTFTLNNQMKVLVISDPTSSKAAASLDVAVGSNANPKEREGLAHFLEHMLFLGTEKYPEAGDYQAFISSHGGNHNAYTAFENTNYFFDIKADSLEPALDRFSQFFISPLFTDKYVDRERHAVHSEYQAKIRDDGRRIYAVTKQILNPENSYSQFSVGSLETLADNENGKIRDDLIKFYQQHYSANLMSLVVLGNQSTADLKALVEAKFTAVPNAHVRPFRNNTPLFKPASLPLKLNIKTVKDLRYMSMTFPMPEVRSQWRKKPLYYISSLVGYEGAGSLLSELKAKGWATGLAASTGTSLPGESTFHVNIALTPEGLQNQEAITQLFFNYIDLIKQGGISETLYQEESDLNRIQFRFQERNEPIHYVSQLSRQLRQYPMQETIRAPYLFEAFDAELIGSYLTNVRPDNMLLTVKARDVETDQSNPWYNVEFSAKPISTDMQQAMLQGPKTAALYIRGTNPFVATNLQLKDRATAATNPQVILEQPGLTLWHQQDASFSSPKANLFFSVMSHRANLTSKDAVLTGLYTRMVKDRLNEVLYDAYVAGLNTDIYPHLKGFSVRLSGYNEKLPVLLEKVTAELKNPMFTEQRFAVIKQQYADQLANAKKEKPFNQTINEIFQLLLPQWSKAEKLGAIDTVSFADLQRFTPELLAETELRVLSHGNMLADEATDMANHIAVTLLKKVQPKHLSQTPVVRLQKGRPFVQTLDLPHNDSAISIYFQGNDSALKTRAEFAILSELMSSPFYSRLRTEKQLGYVVFETPLPLRKAPGLAFVVQSPVADPLSLEEHITHFMDDMGDQMLAMSDTQLEKYKRSVISRILKEENSLSERSARYWNQIDRNNADFHSREALAKSIAELSLQELQQGFKQLRDRQLIVRSFGLKHMENASREEIGRTCDVEINSLKIAGEFMPEA
ncbi:insulinase family protein [Pontibacterium sp. N1Y112]|uniref:Protease 3 n=1 Tax=Pontibacterium sinense TaxID=2781979 RepID=A0A8J7K586_9GAMM|nr:insulinase family protein [Pontibacterium sinense]MBE9396620.1 insulinase family protein [Pontibacterium sinense]